MQQSNNGICVIDRSGCMLTDNTGSSSVSRGGLATGSAGTDVWLVLLASETLSESGLWSSTGLVENELLGGMDEGRT